MADTAPAAALSLEVEVARKLAVAAGQLALRYHRTDIEVDRKAGNEPVTRADREASALIVAGLRARFPDDAIVSEESPEEARRLGTVERAWFVDPVDGTSDFIKGLPGFAVMIGLAVGGRPLVGAIHQPVFDRLLIAAPGFGARAILPDGAWRALRCSRAADPASARLVVSVSHRSKKIDRVKQALGIDDEHAIGSVGLKVGMIAADESDLYVNPSVKTKAWDSCGPEAVLVAAGGCITDLDGRPLRYDTPAVAHPRGFVASNGALHQAVIERLRPLLPELMKS